MQVAIKKLYDANSKEIGSVLTAQIDPNTARVHKGQIGISLEQYARNVLYPQEGLRIFSDIHHDTASIVALRDMNHIKETIAELPYPY